MILDPEILTHYRKLINQQISHAMDALVAGPVGDAHFFERQRGVIIGLGIALDILEDKPATPAETQSGEDDNGDNQTE